MEGLLKRRYPGIRAFEQNETGLFFGREAEQRKLLAMVKVKPLIVVFSKSGIGKSSLLNAGLMPQLDADLFQAIRIRVQDQSQSPATLTKNFLETWVNREKLNQFSGKTFEAASLWEVLRACDFNRNKEVITPVLIFDQFEEFFDHNKALRIEFTEVLANLVNERVPLELQNELRKIPFKNRSVELLEWYSPVPVKVVLAIRSDKMSLLDEMAVDIPSILQNRFHLRPLQKSHAEAAMTRPAEIVSPVFDSPPFHYDPVALQHILSYLSNKEGEIESFQLQLLCQYLENLVREKYKNREGVVLTDADFGGESGINHILNDYYENELAKLTGSEQEIARNFIEEGLIVAGKRVGVSEGVEKESYNVEQELLKKLLNSRLIRAENTHLGRSFEISHDTLVAPILESFNRRKQIEEQLAKEKALAAEQEQLRLATFEAERKLKEEQERNLLEREASRKQLEEEQKRLAREQMLKQRANNFSKISIFLFLVSLIAALLAILYANDAKKQKAVIEIEKQTADSLRQNVSKLYESVKIAYDSLQNSELVKQSLQYDKFMSEAEGHFKNNEYTEAADAYDKALIFHPDDPKALYQRSVARSLGIKKNTYDQLIEEADNYVSKGVDFYEKALDNYIAARKIGIKDPALNSKINTLNAKMEQAYDKFRKDGDIFYNAEGYQFALNSYQKALRMAKRIGRQTEDLDGKIKSCQDKLGI